MPEKRRRSIARIAERYGVYVIEDDVYGPLLEKRPPPISSFLPDLGFYCTSFTKSVMAGLRPGYRRTPTRFALRVNGILRVNRSEENTSELQSLMRISYAVFCL